LRKELEVEPEVIDCHHSEYMGHLGDAKLEVGTTLCQKGKHPFSVHIWLAKPITSRFNNNKQKP
jgi:hypothetical protein